MAKPTEPPPVTIGMLEDLREEFSWVAERRSFDDVADSFAVNTDNAIALRHRGVPEHLCKIVEGILDRMHRPPRTLRSARNEILNLLGAIDVEIRRLRWMQGA